MGDFATALAQARPRLLRLSRGFGVTPGATEDVVQDTLIEAWRQQHRLRDASRLDSWLDGICYNMARRWAREHARATTRHLSLASPSAKDAGVDDIIDPSALDLVEELDRHDLHHLLDRAMGYLPPAAQSTLSLRYVQEFSSAEAAQYLAITPNAFEVRLHRAHQQLRQILTNELHGEAEAFGIAPDPAAIAGWKATRHWCFMCGQHRLIGTFDESPEGAINLRLRCPACSTPDDYDVVQTTGMVPLAGLHTFKPALKRAMQTMPEYIAQILRTNQQVCPRCGGTARLRGIESNVLPYPLLKRFCVVCECPQCGPNAMSVVPSCLALPAVQAFMNLHPRAIIEPEQIAMYAGNTSIQFRIADTVSSARLTVFLDERTLAILGVAAA